MTRTRNTIIAALVALVAFTACNNGPKQGTVVQRGHDDAYSYWQPGIDVPGSCTMIGKIESCNPGIHIPGHFQYVPETWSLKLRTDEGKEGWREVSYGTFQRCEVNDYYPTCTTPQ